MIIIVIKKVLKTNIKTTTATTTTIGQNFMITLTYTNNK